MLAGGCAAPEPRNGGVDWDAFTRAMTYREAEERNAEKKSIVTWGGVADENIVRAWVEYEDTGDFYEIFTRERVLVAREDENGKYTGLSLMEKWDADSFSQWWTVSTYRYYGDEEEAFGLAGEKFENLIRAFRSRDVELAKRKAEKNENVRDLLIKVREEYLLGIPLSNFT